MAVDGVESITQQISGLNVSDNDNATRRPTNQYISLRDAAETILPFDGKNMPVAQFATICTNARNMISPTAEYGLVQMIKNKLVGPALRVALSGEYNNIESLLAVLKTRFAPVYSTSQLHGELAKVTQHPEEAVVDYGSRVSMILHQLKSCYQTESPNQAVQFLDSAEHDAVRNFLTGLKADIYTRIHPRDQVTLNTAIESAIKAETEYNEHAQRMKITEGLMQSVRCNNCLGYGHNTYACSTINPLAQISHVQWQPKTCTFCKNVGHVRAECRALQPRILNRNLNGNMLNTNLNTNRQNFIRNAISNASRQPNFARSDALICRYCKTPGHSLEQCRKRQYNNRIRNQGDWPPRRDNRNFENLPRERIQGIQGNRDRAQRVGATLNERPQVRLVAPRMELNEETQV